MKRELQLARDLVDAHFEMWLRRLEWEFELSDLCRHVVVGAGKALRPSFLFMIYNELRGDSGRPPERVLDAALALEMIHSYSLVHDDLPAMDDDSWRRGRPTLHVLHNEAVAVLAGDALLTGAFEVLGLSTMSLLEKSGCLRELSRAAGGAGMIAGQMKDISIAPRNADEVLQKHRLKTGALFSAAASMATILAAKPEKTEAARKWGVELGLLFQMADDILDETSSRQQLGKSAGKDREQNKNSFVCQHGEAGARRLLQERFRELEGTIDAFGAPESCRAIATFAASRTF